MLRLTAVQLFDHMRDSVIVIERDWRISYCNAEALAAFGTDGLLDRDIWDVFPHARGSKLEDIFRRAFETTKSESGEVYLHDVGGWYEVVAVPAKAELAILFRDVSARREALEQAEARRRALDALFDQVFLGIMQVDGQSQPMLVNGHLCTLTGRTRAELLELPFIAWLDPEDAARLADRLALTSDPDAWQDTVRVVRPDGAVRHCSLTLSRVRDAGAYRHAVLVFDDITEQRDAERNATDTAALLRTIIDSAQDLIFVKDREGRFVLTNHRLSEQAPPMLGDTVDVHFAPTLAAGYAATDAEVLRTGRAATVEERIPLKTGERTFQTIKVPWRSGADILGVIGISRDITDRFDAETRLRTSEERHRLAARATKDAIWDWDLVTDEVTWNPAIKELCGDLPSGSVLWWKDRIHPDDRDRVFASIETFQTSGGERWEQEYRFGRADGSYAHVLDRGFLVRDDSGRPVRMIGAMVDMSERVAAFQRLNELQTELIHVSRVSAMGTMASALAHELNQPLTGVANYVSGARRLLDEQGADAIEAVQPALADAAEQVIKASEIIRRLRRMVARGQVEVQTIALDPLIKDALSLAIPNSRLSQVQVNACIDEAEAVGDPIQIQQVLVNLIRNAVEAMDGRPTRRLDLWCEDRGETLRLYVRDTGAGIAPEIAPRLFAPFATNKPDGLGVGLMISRTILEAHGGSIGVFETGADGTTMFIDLRRSAADS